MSAEPVKAAAVAVVGLAAVRCVRTRLPPTQAQPQLRIWPYEAGTPAIQGSTRRTSWARTRRPFLCSSRHYQGTRNSLPRRPTMARHHGVLALLGRLCRHLALQVGCCRWWGARWCGRRKLLAWCRHVESSALALCTCIAPGPAGGMTMRRIRLSRQLGYDSRCVEWVSAVPQIWPAYADKLGHPLHRPVIPDL
jgi:hypothetical protein